MKKVLILAIIVFSINTYSQGAAYVVNAVNTPTSVSNPPILLGATPIPNGIIKPYLKDDIRWETYNINNFSSQVLSTTSLVYKPIAYTPSSSEILLALGYTPLATEVDPKWTTEKINYYDKTTSDSRYLQSYTETDPIWNAVASTYRTKIQNDLLYQPLLGFTPVPNTRTVNGQTLSSNVVITKSDVGLSNVDNTSDLNKPISTLTQTALNTKLSAEVDGSITNEIQTISIIGNVVSLNLGGGSVNLPISNDYINTAVIAGGVGNTVFYLTSDKTSTGTALYTNINYVNPIINDSSLNYSYSWTYNAGTKALTVNSKAAVGLNISLLGLTLLGVPSNVANGTNVQVLVKGN